MGTTKEEENLNMVVNTSMFSVFDVDCSDIYSPAVCNVQTKIKAEKKDSAPRDQDKENIIYLKLDNLRKIIRRFLTEKGMSKEELANTLKITVKNLEQLFSKEIPAGLLCKVNLPLVSLYCSTKWKENEDENFLRV